MNDAMPAPNRDLLRQEVTELTELLRHNAKWADLRAALRTKNLSPEDLILAGFFEDADGNEFGVIITSKEELVEYERKTDGRPDEFTKWRIVTDASELRGTFPAIEFGRGMSPMSNGIEERPLAAEPPMA
jgi:hypothetical protein